METSRNHRDTVRGHLMIKFLIKLYNKLFKNKHRTILVWSEDTCRIDEKGGPYEVKIK